MTGCFVVCDPPRGPAGVPEIGVTTGGEVLGGVLEIGIGWIVPPGSPVVAPPGVGVGEGTGVGPGVGGSVTMGRPPGGVGGGVAEMGLSTSKVFETTVVSPVLVSVNVTLKV